jgi:hypothetical protein
MAIEVAFLLWNDLGVRAGRGSLARNKRCPDKRDSGTSSTKSASGGTPLPVSQTVASCTNIAYICARARVVKLRILQASSGPTEAQATNDGQRFATPAKHLPYFLAHLQEELSGAFQKLPAVEYKAA